MRKFLILVFLVAAVGAQPLLLNSATPEEIASLPLTKEQADDLYLFVKFQGPVTSIYDLGRIPGFDSATLEELKPLVSLELEKKKVFASRLQDSYRKVENWTAEEGANEGLIELWLDRLAEPINVNNATYDDLMALQNVSPVDAVAVLKRQQEGSIDYPRALRGAIGLSYWGYRNMVDFFTYGEEYPAQDFHFWYNTTFKTFPSNQSSEEGGRSNQWLKPVRSHPGDILQKLVVTPGQHFKAGISYNRQMGQQHYPLALDNLKYAFTFRDLGLGPVVLNQLILGNYSVTMGHGVVMESTDFFSPRRSGYGWSRRVVGVFPDLSRNHQTALQGVAAQASCGPVLAMGFFSRAPRDAIVNADSSFSTLITLYPRINPSNGVNNSIDVLDQVNETTFGANLRLHLKPGLMLGFSTYESLYDRELDPQIQKSVIATANEGLFLTSIGNTADTEIAAMYASRAESPIWDEARALRRVLGFDFTAVIKNLALQGEYGILDKNGVINDFSNDPTALFLSGYLQFNSLSFLVVYRDYDLEFDNPYQRSFSNYQRYKGTIFEDDFYLVSSDFAQLYNGAAQPQAERGIYVNTRYQFHRQFVFVADFDTWTRVADNARYYRTVARLQYRPAFNYRFHIRQKWQMRASYNQYDPSSFYSRETILRAQLRLSRYNNVTLTYTRSFVDFTSRRRLIYNPDTGRNPNWVGSAGSPSEGVGVTVTHNFNDRLKIIGQALVYNGFIWNFEDTDFRVFESTTDALRWWVTVFSRLGNNWAVRVKWTTESGVPITNYAYPPADGGANVRYPDTSTIARMENSDIRVQVDYAF